MLIRLEFVGGPRDGELLLGDTENPLLDEASCFYRATGSGGRVHFWTTTEYATTALRTIGYDSLELLAEQGYRFPGHLYEVVVSRRSARSVYLRAKHVGCSSVG